MAVLLNINVDHVATLRQARRGVNPCPLKYADCAEKAGVDGITVHLREDRRHIQDDDVLKLRQRIKTRLNLEMAVTQEMLAFALLVQPDIVTLVPESREELTTEGGLDVVALSQKSQQLDDTVAQLKQAQIIVSLFVDPNLEQVQVSSQIQADMIELHTGTYANAHDVDIQQHLDTLKNAAISAEQSGLKVSAGHGLNYQNTQKICQIPHLQELNIGHSIVSYSLFAGVSDAVKEMQELIADASNQ